MHGSYNWRLPETGQHLVVPLWATLWNMLPVRVWDHLRREVYRRANGACEVCGRLGNCLEPLECHEAWRYDCENRIKRLIRLVAVCPKCHSASPWGERHNNSSEDDAQGWRLDLSYLKGFGFGVLASYDPGHEALLADVIDDTHELGWLRGVRVRDTFDHPCNEENFLNEIAVTLEFVDGPRELDLCEIETECEPRCDWCGAFIRGKVYIECYSEDDTLEHFYCGKECADQAYYQADCIRRDD